MKKADCHGGFQNRAVKCYALGVHRILQQAREV